MRTAIEAYNDQLPNLTRLGKPADYPQRLMVEDDQVSWDVVVPEYSNRPYCVTDNLAKAISTGIAEPESLYEVDRSFEGFAQDKYGRPLHPLGRTGIGGRGQLYKWGEGVTVDAIVARHTAGGAELLVIRKPGETKPALPGGFIEDGETLVEAAARETQEETAITADPSLARVLGGLFARSKRTTDNAWIKTTGIYMPLPAALSSQIPEGGDDAAEARWRPLTNELLRPMSEHHRVLVQAVIDLGELSLRASQ